MDWQEFQNQYKAAQTWETRTRCLLSFAHEAMQIHAAELAPLVDQCREACFQAGLLLLAGQCDLEAGWFAYDRAQYPQALRYFNRAYEALESDAEGKVKVLNGLAGVQLSLGNFELALSIYREGLLAAQKLEDTTQAIVIQNNIGLVLADLGQFAEAEQHIRAALVSGKVSPLNEVLMLNELGKTLIGQGRLEEARQTLDQSTRLARSGHFGAALAIGLCAQGDLAWACEQWDDADRFLDEAYQVAQDSEDHETEIQALTQRGRLMIVRGTPSKAKNSLERAVSLAQDIGTAALEAQAWKALSLACKETKDWKSALAAHEQFQALTQAQDSQRIGQQLAHIQSDQARREADIYRKQFQLLTNLNALGQKMAANLNLDSIIATLHESIGTILDADAVGLGLLDAKAQRIDYQLWVENGVRQAPFAKSMDTDTLAAWCIQHHKPLCLGNLEQDYAHYVAQLPQTKRGANVQPRSCIYLPLMADDLVLGVLSVQSHRASAYSEQDVAALSTLGVSVAIALQNTRLFEQVNQLATVDTLTGALTRRQFLHRADEEFGRFRREGTQDILVMVDLDHFKAVNDTWGHLFGDQVLASFGQLCASIKRPHDLFGRYGGEEFCFLLSGISPSDAEEWGRRLCRELRALLLVTPTGATTHVTASVGMASLSHHDERITQVLSRADAALYQAKDGGRDRVVISPPNDIYANRT